jgi:hypothetical protein
VQVGRTDGGVEVAGAGAEEGAVVHRWLLVRPPVQRLPDSGLKP